MRRDCRNWHDSIRQHGVFTPILVKKSLGGYELIAGERRLRASKSGRDQEDPRHPDGV